MSIKTPAVRHERTCLKCYACPSAKASKLAKEPAGAQEEYFKRTVTNIHPGGEHGCEVSLKFVFKSTAFIHERQPSIHICTSRTQLTLSNTRRIITPVPRVRQRLLDANPGLDLLLQHIALIHEQDQRRLGQLRRGADRFPEESSWQLMLRSSSKQGMGARKIMVFTSSKYGL